MPRKSIAIAPGRGRPAAQACGYKIGHSEIVKNRARAQAELGSAYDLKGFNTAVVLGGNAPLSVMANTVSRYIAGAKA